MDAHTSQHRPKSAVQGFWEKNGLTVSLFSLFLLSLCGQFLTGHSVYNQTQALHGLKPIPYRQYLATGAFLEGVLENWQAAVLQLASLILFGVYLRQRGAAHSRKPEGEEERPRPQRKRHGWIYTHSLSIALVSLFVLFFTLHLLAGSAAYRTERALAHQPPIPIAAFAVSSKFWFSTFQTWQAEYFAIAVYVVLTIFLRQEKSPESKPVDASNKDTGETDG